jgi:hypothetical protein
VHAVNLLDEVRSSPASEGGRGTGPSNAAPPWLARALTIAMYVGIVLGVVAAAGWFLEAWRPDLVALALEIIGS